MCTVGPRVYLFILGLGLQECMLEMHIVKNNQEPGQVYGEETEKMRKEK